MTSVIPGPKILPTTRVQGSKRSGYVDCQRGQIDSPKSVFLQTQATHFETVMTTLDEVSNKTKVPDEFILRSVLLDCFTAKLDS